jgi:hypothetical protein
LNQAKIQESKTNKTLKPGKVGIVQEVTRQFDGKFKVHFKNGQPVMVDKCNVRLKNDGATNTELLDYWQMGDIVKNDKHGKAFACVIGKNCTTQEFIVNPNKPKKSNAGRILSQQKHKQQGGGHMMNLSSTIVQRIMDLLGIFFIQFHQNEYNII